MLSVLSITTPVFLIMFLGYVCARFKMFPPEAQKNFSLYVFYCAMPCYLFLAMAKSPANMITNISYIISFALGLFIVAAISWFIASRIFKLKGEQSILAMMGGSYTNSAFIGIPIIVMAFGEPGPVIVIALFQILIVTTLILTAIETFQKHGSLSLNTLYQLPKTIILNPIVGGSLLGILFSLMKWNVPQIINNSFGLLGNAGIPTALFALGLSLGVDRKPLSKEQRTLVYSLMILKNIVHPLIAGLIGYYIFNLSEMWLGALIVVSAMPTAMNNFIFSQRYNTFVSESSQLVFFSSILSLFTLSGLLWWFTAN